MSKGVEGERDKEEKGKIIAAFSNELLSSNPLILCPSNPSILVRFATYFPEMRPRSARTEVTLARAPSEILANGSLYTS